jgi:hypothetical protein
MTEDNQDWLAKGLNDPIREIQLLQTEPNITLYPLAGYSTATISANGALLTLEFVLPPPEAGTRILRLGMTRAQCSELSQALERLAILPHRSQAKPS